MVVFFSSYQPLAVWDEEKKLIFNDNNVNEAKGFRFPFKENIPKSRCSEPCSLGHQKIEHSVCCWACTPCRPNQRLNETGNCENCTAGWWPTSDFELVPHHLFIKAFLVHKRSSDCINVLNVAIDEISPLALKIDRYCQRRNQGLECANDAS